MNGPALRDIHLPQASWWPPAPGWWLLAGLLLLVACGLVWRLRRAARGGALRAALREIDALEAEYGRNADDLCLADGASRLMRRVALQIEPRVGAQTGAAWDAFVQRHARDAATLAVLDGLAVARFRAHADLDAPALLAALRSWCTDALGERARRRAGSRATVAKEAST